MIAAKFLTLQTAASGATYVPFSSQPCSIVNVVNNTGTALSFVHTTDANSVEFVLPDGMAYAFTGINNADQLKVRRTDASDTQVTLNSVEVEL